MAAAGNAGDGGVGVAVRVGGEARQGLLVALGGGGNGEEEQLADGQQHHAQACAKAHHRNRSPRYPHLTVSDPEDLTPFEAGVGATVSDPEGLTPTGGGYPPHFWVLVL